MLDLIIQYKQALKDVRRLQSTANDEDRKLLGGMASDLEYALEWMQTARQPGNRRGIERRAAYQRELPLDPVIMQSIFPGTDDVHEWDKTSTEQSIGSWDDQRLKDALSILTDREREIYLMKRGYDITFSEIARLLGISDGAVKTMFKRADKKISAKIKLKEVQISLAL